MASTMVRFLAALLTAGALGVGEMSDASSGAIQMTPEQDAAAAAEFTRRVQAYADLHRRIEGPVPTVKVSGNPMEIRDAMNRLAASIRKERAEARQGDIFSPSIAAMFRFRMDKLYGGRYAELLAIINEEVEQPVAPRLVNGRWPVGAPFSFFPPDLLCSLPPLPDELEYRFIHRDLVLWDVHADLIIDLIPNAIPPLTN